MPSRSDQQSRRQFLTDLSAWTFVAAMHPALVHAAEDVGVPPSPRRRSSPLIRELRLRTAAPLEEMEAFYRGVLGFRLEGRTDTSLAVRVGVTRITFIPVDPARDSQRGGDTPFYHFAFNIPENKLLAARDWLRERTPLIEIPPGLRDPRFPDDVVHFRNWNAHSLFFFDPAGNVLEQIARHDLDNAADGPFTSRDMSCASEIGLVTDDVVTMAADIGRTFQLKPYRNASDAFTAMGDEQGLVLVFRRGRNVGFDSKPPRLAGVFPTGVEIDGVGKTARYEAESYPFSIVRD